MNKIDEKKIIRIIAIYSIVLLITNLIVNKVLATPPNFNITNIVLEKDRIDKIYGLEDISSMVQGSKNDGVTGFHTKLADPKLLYSAADMAVTGMVLFTEKNMPKNNYFQLQPLKISSNNKRSSQQKDIEEVLQQLKNNDSVSFSINKNNIHWLAATIKKEKVVIEGKQITQYILYTNDSLGGRVSIGEEAKFRAALKNCGINAENFQQKDFKMKIQHDGTSCGAFSVETMKIFVESKSEKEIKQKLAKLAVTINSVRLKHARYATAVSDLADDMNKPFIKQDKNKQANYVREKIKQEEGLVHRTAQDISEIIDSRFPANLIGVAAGDTSPLKRGVWAKGFFGKGQDTGEVIKEDSKAAITSSLVGITAGADTELDENAIIGIAVSYIIADTKFKLNDTDNDKDQLLAYFGTVYIGSNITPSLSVNSNFAYGWYSAKKNELADQKEKGTIIYASTKANYRLYNNKSVAFLLNTTLSYSGLKRKKAEDTPIQVEQNRQHQLSSGVGLKTMLQGRFGKVDIKPEIHVNYDYLFYNSDVDIKLKDAAGQLILADIVTNNSNHIFKVGAGINLLTAKSEVGVGFELSRHGTNQANIGYAKLRINF